MKFNDNTARDFRSYIQNLIILEQRGGVAFAQIELPPLPEFPEAETLREAISSAREAAGLKAKPEKAEKEESKEKISFFSALITALAERRAAKAERRAMMLAYKLTCRGKEVRYNVERRICLEKIAAYEKVLSYLEAMYIDGNEESFNPAGGTVNMPVPMHTAHAV